MAELLIKSESRGYQIALVKLTLFELPNLSIYFNF